MSNVAFVGKLPRYESGVSRFQPAHVENVLNRNPIVAEVAMATARNNDPVTWVQLTRIAGIVAFFLLAITWFMGRELDGLKDGIKENTVAVHSLADETTKGMASIREQLVETNTNLKNLIVETRQNRPH